jgi:serine/threonine-protein kinase
MGRSRWNKIEEIIDKLLDLPEDQRIPYLDSNYTDKDLKTEVIEMLQSITDSEGWLEGLRGYRKKAFDGDFESISSLSSDTLIGTDFGSYTITEKIGEGGMGVIFLAERSDDSFQHQVAIKIIRNGRATEENIQRFKREQNILARLNHPGIAQLYDGGVTDEGFPYIIMEFVDGIPITQYCEENNCSVSEKIKLIRQVLNAVQNAHENLTVHRDLKPDNILIDRSGNVKILDFGISKLLEDEDNLMLTQTGSKILTPRYAAPEQIKGTNITTATDMYSLGVVFYKLLTGIDPYQLDDKTRYEVEQTIIHDEPCKPSEAVSDPQLKRRLKGDLDAILLKSMRKEYDKRYRVASEFLEDLKHFEAGLPVGAHEGSFTYKTRKFVKRNKLPIAYTLATFIILLSTAIYYTSQLRSERNLAQIEAQKAESVKNFIVEIFEANDPILNDEDEIPSLPTILEVGSQKILDKHLQPSVKTELLLILSTIYQNISDFDKAQKLAQTSLEISETNFGVSSLNVARSYIQVAGLNIDLGKYEKGKSDLLKAEKLLKNHGSTPNSLYIELYDHLGYVEEDLGNYKASIDHFQRSLDLNQNESIIDTAIYISSLRSVARGFYRFDNPEIADSLMLKALNYSEKFHGQNDIVTASVLGDLGLYHMTRAKYDSARNYFNRSLFIKEDVYGEEGHPNLTATLTNLGVLEEYTGNYNKAKSIFTRTMEIDKSLFGEDHPYVAMSKSHLAGINLSLNNVQKAKELYKETMDIYLDSYSPDHYYMGGIYKGYARSLSKLNSFTEATQYFNKALEVYEKNDITDDAVYAKLFEATAYHFKRAGDYEKANGNFQKCAELFAPLYYDEYKIRSAKCQMDQVRSLLKLNKKDRAQIVLNDLQLRIDSTEVLLENQDLLELVYEIDL